MQREDQNKGIIVQKRIVRKVEITTEIMDRNFGKLESQHKDFVDEAIKSQFEMLSAVKNTCSLPAENFAEL